MQDDTNIPGYGVFPTESAQPPRGQRSRRSFRRDADPPRASCDTISQPPVWSDLAFSQHTYLDPHSRRPYHAETSMQGGRSSFSGFGTYYNPGPSSQTAAGPSLFSSGEGFGQAGPASYSIFSSGAHSRDRMSSDYATPSTNIFPPFHSQYIGTLSNRPQPDISSMRSRLDDDDDDDDEDDGDEDDDGDDNNGDDDRAGGNEGDDNRPHISPERTRARGIPLLRRLLPRRNRRRPRCGTD